jgi:hypothetical protein
MVELRFIRSAGTKKHFPRTDRGSGLEIADLYPVWSNNSLVMFSSLHSGVILGRLLR